MGDCSSDLHKHKDLRDIKRSQGFLFYYFYFVFFTHSHKRNIYSLPLFLIDFFGRKNGKVHIEFTFRIEILTLSLLRDHLMDLVQVAVKEDPVKRALVEAVVEEEELVLH